MGANEAQKQICNQGRKRVEGRPIKFREFLKFMCKSDSQF